MSATQPILARIEQERATLIEELDSIAAESSTFRLARQARVEALGEVLSWLPKELNRLVIAVRDEEELPCCDHCDETADHEPPCVLRSNVTSYEVARELAMERIA